MSRFFFPLLLFALIGFLSFGPIDTQFKKTASQYTGLTTLKISISGTGSMYPTFPKGKGKTLRELEEEQVAVVDMYVYPSKRFSIGRGDIVEFSNVKTNEIIAKDGGSAAGFVKRVIGLPGDSVEIRGGEVFVNGQIPKEPYTALARATFGGEFLTDCKKLVVPKGQYFVLGDNRKASNDSRHDVGLIDDKDIGFILPFGNQRGIWDKNYRDISNDSNPASKIKLDKQKYLEFLNTMRKQASLKPLKYNDKLETSALLRGKNILKFNDFSFEATRSGFTIEDSFAQSGYWNPIRGESIIQGYYSSDELIEGLLEFKKSEGIFADGTISEIGIAEVEGEINGCPTQVIVSQFAGYVPPNYPKEQIESFQNGLTNLKNISPGWKSLKDPSSADFYKKEQENIDRIIQIIETRILKLEPIVAKVLSNQWFSAQENNYLKEDEVLSNEQNDLAQKINRAIKDQ